MSTDQASVDTVSTATVAATVTPDTTGAGAPTAGGTTMPTITYLDPDGGRHDIVAHVMDTAVKNGVPGVVAECGGFLSCASCHVHVDDAWIDRVGRAEDNDDDLESEILDGAMAERTPGSRLSCQIVIDDSLDGLLVRVAPEQF
jgi:2Fe-2S ferredoxin